MKFGFRCPVSSKTGRITSAVLVAQTSGEELFLTKLAKDLERRTLTGFAATNSDGERYEVSVGSGGFGGDAVNG